MLSIVLVLGVVQGGRRRLQGQGLLLFGEKDGCVCVCDVKISERTMANNDMNDGGGAYLIFVKDICFCFVLRFWR